MSEMVERVARAILDAEAKAEGLEGTIAYSFSDQDEHFHESYRAMARAAIQAMREPTEEMIRAADGAVPDGIEPINALAWRAMIDKALEE